MQFILQNRNQRGFRMFNTLTLQGSHYILVIQRFVSWILCNFNVLNQD